MVFQMTKIYFSYIFGLLPEFLVQLPKHLEFPKFGEDLGVFAMLMK